MPRYEQAVTALRHQLMRHRLLAAWLIALSLAMKLLVPSGYMIGVSAGSITIELCSGYGAEKMVAMPGMAHHSTDKENQGKADMPCAFSGLSATSLAAADLPLLAAAIAYILSSAHRITVAPTLSGTPAYLRPPLRGPPLHA